MLPKSSVQTTVIDPVTCFSNRSHCVEGIVQLALKATPERPLSIIWIALDRIKTINESFGHQGGDVVIAQIARRLKNLSAPDARWFRMSGDEFVCLISDHDRERTRGLATDLLYHIQKPMPFGELLLHPSASLGIACFETDETPSDCLERAYRAMNAAKRAGGGRIVDSEMESVPGRRGIPLARHELEVENKLHLAIGQGGLSLHYQPIVAADGHIVSVEALMRCTSHRLSPGEFIPIAEKTGLIIRLGEWCLLEGARFARRLVENGLRTPVAINVSRAQFALPGFPKILHAALMCANVEPGLIELELTESLFMDNSKVVQKNLRAAQEIGVKIAIDDFGTGYSCLAILKDIHATKLKIDRAFVVALPHDRRAFSVVRSIAQLGENLGMQVVAEGVETQEQLDSLHGAGVHSIQGYLYAHPMHEDALSGWLQDRKK